MAEKKVSMSQVVIGGLLVAVVVGAFWVGKLTTELKLLKSQPQGTQQAGGAQQPQVAAATVLGDDQWQKLLQDPVASLGKADAKVIMVEFTDFQCPFCKRAFEQSFSEIKKQYIDTGKIKYIVRDLPLGIHPNAPAAALAVRCAAEQGKYWEMHDKLFEKQEEWSGLSDPGQKFKEYAGSVGVNGAKFASCLDGEKYKQAIDADLALANSVGASGTPTFFIDGRSLVGAQPFAAFKAVIEEELKK